MPEGFKQNLGAKIRYGVDWAAEGWLAEGVTITESNWAVSPVTGLTVSDQQDTPPGAITKTSVMVEAESAGYYRLTNSVIATDGSTDSYEFLIAVESATAPEGSYMTPSEAETRLWGEYGIESELSVGDLLAAASELDSMGPWIGSKQDSGQILSFPRSVNRDGTTNDSSTAPDAILDAVALLAHHDSSDEGPAVTSESVLDRSLTYATPKIPQALTRIENLIKPYQLKVGQRVGVSAYEPSED